MGFLLFSVNEVVLRQIKNPQHRFQHSQVCDMWGTFHSLRLKYELFWLVIAYSSAHTEDTQRHSWTDEFLSFSFSPYSTVCKGSHFGTDIKHRHIYSWTLMLHTCSMQHVYKWCVLMLGAYRQAVVPACFRISPCSRSFQLSMNHFLSSYVCPIKYDLCFPLNTTRSKSW